MGLAKAISAPEPRGAPISKNRYAVFRLATRCLGEIADFRRFLRDPCVILRDSRITEGRASPEREASSSRNRDKKRIVALRPPRGDEKFFHKKKIFYAVATPSLIVELRCVLLFLCAKHTKTHHRSTIVERRILFCASRRKDIVALRCYRIVER